MFQISSYEAPETLALGGQFSRILRPGDSVGLTGDLGSGKTLFTAGICAGLGFTDAVTSPTFTLLHLYPTIPPLYHFDCFRMKSAQEIASAGLDDFLSLKQGIIIVEWADVIREYFSDWSYEIDFTFDFESENLRILHFSSRQAGYSKRLYDFLGKVLSKQTS
jgi:tRNA threonylcarbamoyladenosine biosynthesis protein TsaE